MPTPYSIHPDPNEPGCYFVAKGYVKAGDRPLEEHRITESMPAAELMPAYTRLYERDQLTMEYMTEAHYERATRLAAEVHGVGLVGLSEEDPAEAQQMIDKTLEP